MNTTESLAGIPEEVKAQLRQTLDYLAKGIRHPDKMKAACERMDRMREENRKLFGSLTRPKGPARKTNKPD